MCLFRLHSFFSINVDCCKPSPLSPSITAELNPSKSQTCFTLDRESEFPVSVSVESTSPGGTSSLVAVCFMMRFVGSSGTRQAALATS